MTASAVARAAGRGHLTIEDLTAGALTDVAVSSGALGLSAKQQLGFDGATTSLSLGDNLPWRAWTATSTFSVAILMRRGASGVAEALFGDDGTGSNSAIRAIVGTDGLPKFSMVDKSNITASVKGSIQVVDDQWHWLEFVRDGSLNGSGGAMKVYIDGKLDPGPTEVVATLGSFIHQTPLRVGSAGTLTATNAVFTGKIAEVRIWSVARTAAEVLAETWTALTGTEANLEGLWRCNEGVGSTVADASPNGRTAKAPWTSPNYLRFPGVSPFTLSTPDNAVLHITGDRAECCGWALDDWTPPTGTITLCGRFAAAANESWTFQLTSAGKLQVVVSTTGSNTATFTMTNALAVSDGDLLLVGYTFDVDNGSSQREVKFYSKTSTPDSAFADVAAFPAGFTLLETKTAANTPATFAGTSALEIGSDSGGATRLAAGKFYGYGLWSDIAGASPVLKVDPHNFVPTDATITDSVNGRVFTLTATRLGPLAFPAWSAADTAYYLTQIDIANFANAANTRDILGTGMPATVLASARGLPNSIGWYEQTAPTVWEQHDIDPAASYVTKLEGLVWIHLGAYGWCVVGCDQDGKKIWVWKPSNPDDLAGSTWTAGTIANKPFCHDIIPVNLGDDAQEELVFTYEGADVGDGGVESLQWNGGDPTDDASWTNRVLLQHGGACFIAKQHLVDGLVDLKGDGGEYLCFTARDATRNNPVGAVPGVYLAKKPATWTDPWTEVTVDATNRDFTHVDYGDFSGAGHGYDIVSHWTVANDGSEANAPRWYERDAAFAVHVLPSPTHKRSYNLRNITRRGFARDCIWWVCQNDYAYIYEPDVGVTYAYRALWSVGYSHPYDGAVDLFDLDGDGNLEAVAPDSGANRLVWLDFDGIILHAPSGSRVGPSITVGGRKVRRSRVTWDAAVPSASALTVETSIDDGTSWQSATNGGPISGAGVGDDAPASVKTRTSLTTSDPRSTPNLRSLYVICDAHN